MRKAKKANEVISLTMLGMDGLLTEQNEARLGAELNDMQERMRKPLTDVSKAAGEMERESPLFFGCGDNPSLF